MRRTCIICKSNRNKVVFRESRADVLRCRNCGHVFSSYEADQDFDGYFGYEPIESGEQFWWNEAHRAMYEDFCRKLLRGRSGKLLDVGCGLGFFLKHVSAYPAWQVFGYEISQQGVDFARNKLQLRNVSCGKVEESRLRRKNFDIITLWDVIEHIPDPDPFLSYLTSILKDDGFLFMHTPNVQNQLPKARLKVLLRGMRPGIQYLDAKDHVNIYSPKLLAQVLRRNGFRDVTFDHLRPIQSVSGGRSRFLRAVKNGWYYSSVMLSHMTLGRVNVDNLFVKAKKGMSAA